MAGKYDDIINLKPPVSKKHGKMSMHDRAAQFSAFAALSGYGDAVDETTKQMEESFNEDGRKKGSFEEINDD